MTEMICCDEGEWASENYCRLPKDGWINEVVDEESHVSSANQAQFNIVTLGFCANARCRGFASSAKFEIILAEAFQQ